MLRILFLGDIVGEPGRKAVIAHLAKLKDHYQADFVIANGENSAGGRGITPKIAMALMRAGVSVITTGDHVWDQREIGEYFLDEPRLLRPINFPDSAPGAGSVVVETDKARIGVLNVMGRTFMNPPLDNPFEVMDREVGRLQDEADVLFVDMHAETTSEKGAMARFLDGRVSAVVGTHTHVQTGDERILPKGTGFLTDAGMCGPEESILGRRPEPIIQRFLDGMPVRYPVAKGAVRLCGALFTIDVESGRCEAVERVSELIEN